MSYQVFQKGPRKGEPKTIQDRVSQYLETRYSAVETDSPSRKYKRYLVGDKILFVGKNGGVRMGKSISVSFSITSKIRNEMEQVSLEGGFKDE